MDINNQNKGPDTVSVHIDNDASIPVPVSSSGIFIEGVDMPECCAECRFKACVLFEMKKADRIFSVPDIFKFLNNDYSGNRYSNCPIRPAKLV